MKIITKKGLTILVVSLFTSLISLSAYADKIAPELQSKIDQTRMKLENWAKDPAFINAVTIANTQSTSLTNKKWKSLKISSPEVAELMSSKVSKKLIEFEKDKTLGKLFLRDKNGNLVAGSKKPAVFNIQGRPAFDNAIRGKTWNSKKVKADPTTKLKSVQISTPIISAGKNIGIIHTSLIVN